MTVAALQTQLDLEAVDKTRLTNMPTMKEFSQKTIDNSVSALKVAGLLEGNKQGLKVTKVGMAQIDPRDMEGIKAPTTNQEHFDNIKKNFKLTRKQIEVVDLIKCGRTFSKNFVYESMGFKTNKTFDNNMSKLKSMGIIEYVGANNSSIRLTAMMFPFEPRAE